MNVFVFVSEFKTNTSFNINLTNTANPEYCNISNPGPLEQKPGLCSLGLLEEHIWYKTNAHIT